MTTKALGASCFTSWGLTHSVCHAGQNRSQAMNMVLHDLAPEGVEILAPHGALSGFDPYQGYETRTTIISSNMFFDLLIKEKTLLMIKQTEVLLKLLGSLQTCSGSDIHKSLGSPLLNYRHGENTFAELAMQRTLLRNLMSGHIWRAHRAERYPRQVYVCFGRAAGIAARRIVESNPEGSLERVHIISLPWGDPVPQASGGYCRA